jgi:GNAT superfamily N-acetyltransferase
VRHAYALLEPEDGFSVVVTGGSAAPDLVVAVGTCARKDDRHETALLVEDGWQRLGVGTRLLQALMREATLHGIGELTMLSHPDNRAVPALLHRSGLRPRVSRDGALSRYAFGLGTARSGPRRPARSVRDGRGVPGVDKGLDRSLVELLHRRAELRSVHPVADALDAALRDGA